MSAGWSALWGSAEHGLALSAAPHPQKHPLLAHCQSQLDSSKSMSHSFAGFAVRLHSRSAFHIIGGSIPEIYSTGSAFQHCCRAAIVGEQSFGKGLVGASLHVMLAVSPFRCKCVLHQWSERTTFLTFSVYPFPGAVLFSMLQ